MENKQDWTKIIKSEESFFKLNLKEVLEYKDLIFLLTKKNFTTMYKQTILGPLWKKYDFKMYSWYCET